MQNVIPSNTAPAQNYVSGNSANNPAATPPINFGYGGAIPSNNLPGQDNSTQAAEMQRLQLAQQLTQLAQTLVTGNQTAVSGVGLPPASNPQYNTQLNQQLNGGTLPQIPPPPPK
jgi:hypothetical protein